MMALEMNAEVQSKLVTVVYVEIERVTGGEPRYCLTISKDITRRQHQGRIRASSVVASWRNYTSTPGKSHVHVTIGYHQRTPSL